MSAERVTYLDSSAIVKLAITEPESGGLRRFLRNRRPLVSSALARTEVARAMLPFGPAAVDRGDRVLQSIDLIRINDRLLGIAAAMRPPELGSLDAIHLATAQSLGDDLSRVCTYDDRMAAAAGLLGLVVVAPA